MSDYNIRPIIVGILVVFVVSMVGALSAVLFIKLSGIDTATDFQLVKQTLIFGFIIYILIISGMTGMIEYLRMHHDKQKKLLDTNAEVILGKSELMRYLHNEIKRNDGNELQLLEDDHSLLMILQEISDLQKIAKLQRKRKRRTAPGQEGSGLHLEIEKFIKAQEDKGLNAPSNNSKT